MRSTDLNAVVTGGGSGLGRSLALEIARRGGRVIIADIARERAESVAREVDTLVGPGKAFATACDVTKVEQVEALATFADDTLGSVSLVVNNAGVAVGGHVGEVSLDDWRWVAEVNLWGVVHGCHVFLPRLKQQGGGAILNVASAAGLLSPPQLGPYNITKAAVVALSETLYAEAKPHGVHVTVLCPTFFRTGLLDTARGTDESTRAFVAKLMDGSRVQSDDVARAALDALQKRELYCVPMADGRTLWALKRALPQRFLDLIVRWAPVLRKRRGLDSQAGHAGSGDSIRSTG